VIPDVDASDVVPETSFAEAVTKPGSELLESKWGRAKRKAREVANKAKKMRERKAKKMREAANKAKRKAKKMRELANKKSVAAKEKFKKKAASVAASVGIGGKRNIREGDIMTTSQLSTWMKHLPDATQLKDVNMPGTHDTAAHTCGHKLINKGHIAAKAFGAVAGGVVGVVGVGALINGNHCKTQNWTFKSQLKHGIRYFDMRSKRPKGLSDLWMYHGPVPLGMKLTWLMKDARDFLKEHPSETVFMRTKREKGGDVTEDQSKRFSDEIAEVIQETGSSYFAKGVKATTPMKDLRGKIVLFHSSGWKASPPVTDYGMRYAEVKTQDDYAPNSRLDKWKAVKEGVKAARDKFQNDVFINYASAQVCGLGGMVKQDENGKKIEAESKSGIRCKHGDKPQCMPRPIQCVSDYLYEDQRLPNFFHCRDGDLCGRCIKKNGRVGIVALDYPDKRMDMVSDIIRSNQC